MRKIIELKYTEEEDAQIEEASTLVTRMERRKQAEVEHLQTLRQKLNLLLLRVYMFRRVNKLKKLSSLNKLRV